MAGNQAVAKKAESLPANLMDDLYAGAGQGMENITAEDMQIPFMRILQPLSPQLIKTDSKFIKGASAGDIFNTVTGQYLGRRRRRDDYPVRLRDEVPGVPTA